MSRIVKLNIGGTRYETSISTMTQYPNSMLATMIQQPQELQMIQNGQELFIDRDGERFKYIMDYLRDGVLVVLPDGDESILRQLLLEAQFFMLDGLKPIIASKLRALLTKDGWKIGDFVSLGDVRPNLMDKTMVFRDFKENGARIIGDPVGKIIQFGNDERAAVQMTCRWWIPPTAESIKEIYATYMMPLRSKIL